MVEMMSETRSWSARGEGRLFGDEETTELSGNYSHDLEQTEASTFMQRGQSCLCAQHVPRNILVFQSTNNLVPGWA